MPPSCQVQEVGGDYLRCLGHGVVRIQAASALRGKLRGSAGIPAALRLSRTITAVSAFRHLVLLCRVAGLRRAAVRRDVELLGGGEYGMRAEKELERLMGSSDRNLRAELAAFQVSWRMARSLALPTSCKSFHDRAAAVIGLFLSWVFSEGARALEVGAI